MNLGIMNYEDDLKRIRLDILEMAYKNQEGHIPTAFSVAEILYVIYSKKKEEDVFFLSKGHASAALYAVLAHFGHLDRRELTTFCQYDSLLGGHPHRRGKIIMNSSGSLGHGFPMAAGYALSKKIKNEPGRVFCLVGDGECNEGTIWETAMYASHLNLSNLVCIVDNNNSQTRAIPSVSLKEKFASFGWKIDEIDGHNVLEIERALFGKRVKQLIKPLAVIANTIKGRGIKAMENDHFAWHHRVPTETEFNLFKAELLL